MVRKMSARDARTHFADVLGSVHYSREPVIVERRGKPFAVVINPHQYEVMERELGRAWLALEAVQARNADRNPDEVLSDVTSAVRAVRQERYAKRTKTSQGRR